MKGGLGRSEHNISEHCISRLLKNEGREAKHLQILQHLKTITKSHYIFIKDTQ